MSRGAFDILLAFELASANLHLGSPLLIKPRLLPCALAKQYNTGIIWTLLGDNQHTHSRVHATTIMRFGKCVLYTREQQTQTYSQWRAAATPSKCDTHSHDLPRRCATLLLLFIASEIWWYSYYGFGDALSCAEMRLRFSMVGFSLQICLWIGISTAVIGIDLIAGWCADEIGKYSIATINANFWRLL
jgi:hypothetical protein